MTMLDQRPCVLVVDDDADLRALAQLQLGRHFEVLAAGSGRDGIRVAATERPDVIVLDVVMDDMSGTDVLVRLGSDPKTAGIPVVFVSNLDSVDVRVEGLDLGAVDFITRPVDHRELVARVTAAFRRSESRAPTPNEAAFRARLSEEVARAARSGAPLSVLAIEVDGDRAEGDLGSIERKLRATLRSSDLVYGRPAGFWVMLPDTPVASAYLAAERCRLAVTSLNPDGRSTTLSIGVAERTAGHPANDLRHRALSALRLARDSGGDRAWRYDDPRKRSLNPVSLSVELTEREWEVLAHLVLRRTEQEIARRLEISAGTVRSHKARIRRKLHVPPEVRLADFARSNFHDALPSGWPAADPHHTGA